MGARKGHGAGSGRDRAARRGAQRESLARLSRKTVRALEEDLARSIAAIPPTQLAGTEWPLKAGNRFRFPQRRFARDAFRAANRFVFAEGSARPAGGKRNLGNRSRRRLDRGGVCLRLQGGV